MVSGTRDNPPPEATLFIYLLNFNYTDLNIQIVDKLTIKINEKLQKLQDLNN